MSTIVELVPNADKEIVNAANQALGTTNLYQSIDETAGSPNDADYIRVQATYPARYTPEFGNITLAANERIRRVRLRFRASNATAGVDGIRFRYRNNATGEVLTEEQVVQSTSSWVAYTRSWYVSGPAGGGQPHTMPWSKTLVDRLGVQFYAKNPNGTLRVSQASVEVDKYTQAVTSAVTVTGNTTTSRPTVTATYADTVDGQDADRVEVQIFAAAVYGAAGFSPNSSAPTWTSGVVLGLVADGGVISQVVGADLVDGTTYKAYVRAAKPFNGSPWWTEWASSSSFTITLTKPSAPLLQVTTDVDLTFSKLRTRIEVVGGGVNLLTANQSSIETDATGWTVGGNCTLAQTAAQAADGTKSLQMTAVASGNMWANTTPGGASGTPVPTGKVYTALASFRSAVTARSCRVAILWYDVAGTLLSQNNGAFVTDSTSAWTAAVVTANAPADAAFAVTQVLVDSTPAAAEVHYVDKISLHEGTSTTWQVGGNSTDLLVVERAQLNDGILNLAHPQLASGTEETNTQAGFFSTEPGDALFSDNRTSVMGRRSLGWLIFSTSSKLSLGLPMGTFGLDQTGYALPAVPGATMVLSLYARATSSTTATLALEAVDAAGTVLGSAATKSITIPGTGTFTRFSVQLTGVNASAVLLRAHILNTSGVTGQTVNVDGIQLREGTDPDSQAWIPGQGRTPTFAVVRGGDALAPATIDNPRIVYDEEVPPGRVVVYKATVVRAPDLTNRVTSLPTVAPAVKLALPSDHVLKDPLDPQSAMPIRIMAAPEQIAEDTEVLRPLGRPDPLVVSTVMTGRDMQLILLAEGLLAKAQLEQLMLVRNALLIQFAVTGGMRYVRLTSRSFDLFRPDDLNPGIFVTADSLEVGPPV